MSTALTQSQGGALANADAANPFLAAGDGAGNATFMKFVGQSGAYLYGQDDDEMERGTLMAADIQHAKYSWSFWWDGEVLESFEVSVIENPRAFEQEPDHLPEDYDDDMSLEEIREARKDQNSNFMDGWSVQGIVGLRALDGEMEEFTLKLNAGVGMRAFQSMLGAYGRMFRMKAGLTPIIKLDARKYKSKIKSVGTRWAPELKVADWRSEEDLVAAAGENPADYADEEDIIPEEGDEGGDEGAAESTTDDAKPRGRAARRGPRGRNLG